MKDDKPLKSAYELAMERLRAKDREQGRDQPKTLTAAQKKRIAALRERANAKLAEIEILYDKKRASSSGDQTELDKLEQQYQTDRRRVTDRLEADVARVRSGKLAGGD